MTDTAIINELLNDRRYHIEFNGHLTNHVKHAVVALAGLGTPPQRIKSYYESYANLTSYGFGLEPPRHSGQCFSENNWQQSFGRRTGFASYCEFFDHRERDLGLHELVRRYVPALLPGWVGSFTHAAIHLGWALDVNHRWMTIEGLAYMAFSYVSCHPERCYPTGDRNSSNETAVDSVLRIAAAWEEDRDGIQCWVEELLGDTDSDAAKRIHPELTRSGLQYRIARLLGEGHDLIYEIPSWIHDQDASTSWEQLCYVTTLLYLSEPGDFVLLHLITSLYGMEHIANQLPADQQRDVVRCFWIGMLCVTFSRARFPKTAKLQALHSIYERALDVNAQESAAWKQDWEQIIGRAIEEEEEHNPKLVYVMRRVWQRTRGLSIYRNAAAQFTTTPELPPSFNEPPVE